MAAGVGSASAVWIVAWIMFFAGAARASGDGPAHEDKPAAAAPARDHAGIDDAAAINVIAERLNARYAAISRHSFKVTETAKEAGTVRSTAEWECWYDGSDRAIKGVREHLSQGIRTYDRYLHTRDALVISHSDDPQRRPVTRYELQNGKGGKRIEQRHSVYRGPVPLWYATSFFVSGADYRRNTVRDERKGWTVKGDINGQELITLQHSFEGKVVVELVIDPSRGFLIVERITHTPSGTHTIQLFPERVGDHWFPMKMVEKHGPAGLEVTLEFRDLRLNEAMPADNFQMGTFFDLHDRAFCTVYTIHDERKPHVWIDGSLVDAATAHEVIRKRQAAKADDAPALQD